MNTDFIGTDWAELPAPPELRFLNIALGDRVAWAITMDGRAWFARLNPDGSEAILNDGSWLDMNCVMSYLSVGPSDHVFGVGLMDDAIYYRTDITEKELSGRTWQAILASVSKEETLVKDEVAPEEISAVPDGKAITVFDGQTLAKNISRKKSGKENVETSRSIPLVVAYRRSNMADGIVRLFSTEGKEKADANGDEEAVSDIIDGLQDEKLPENGKEEEADEGEGEISAEEGQECEPDDQSCSEASTIRSDVYEPATGLFSEDEESGKCSTF